MAQFKSKQEWRPKPSKSKTKYIYEDGTHKLNNWGVLDRFLYIGNKSSYYTHDTHPHRVNAQCIERLISDGKGTEVVQHLLHISQSGRTLRQNYLIFALAICARSNDLATRQEAYKNINYVCRTPTHFFTFVNYCKQESLISGSTGWGRAHRRAIINWYKEKSKNPAGLARHLTKYKARKMHTNDGKGEIWSHKKVLRMAHPKFEDNLMKVVTKYVMFGFEEAQRLASSTEMKSESISQFLSKIEGTEKAKSCQDEDELTALIKHYQLEREQIPTQLMNSKKVGEAIMANMKAEAKIRNITLMASKGLCDKESECERLIMEILSDQKALHDERVHPIRLLIALLSYKKGEKKAPKRNENDTLQWNLNQNICQRLESAFYRSFKDVEALKKKRFLLAISLSNDMAKLCQGCPTLNCQQAAAAMMMLTVKTEEKCDVVVFSDGLTEISINKKHSLEEVIKEIGKREGSCADPSLPIRWATEKKRKYDAFIVYSDNITTSSHNVSQELNTYKQEMKIPDSRMIVVAMTANQGIFADELDPFILNIAGFDSNAARLIQSFASSEI